MIVNKCNEVQVQRLASVVPTNDNNTSLGYTPMYQVNYLKMCAFLILLHIGLFVLMSLKFPRSIQFRKKGIASLERICSKNTNLVNSK